MPTRQHQPYNSAVIGHGLALVIGAVSLVAGFASMAKGFTTVLPVTLIVLGLILGFSAVMSWQHFSRASWSLLISTLCVFAAVTFFGSPKIANVLHVKIWLAMLIPIVQVVAVIMLADLRREYREQ